MVGEISLERDEYSAGEDEEPLYENMDELAIEQSSIIGRCDQVFNKNILLYRMQKFYQLTPRAYPLCPGSIDIYVDALMNINIFNQVWDQHLC